MGVCGLRFDRLEATPFDNEKRHGTCNALQRGEADAFIEAVNVLGDRAITEGRDLVLERIHARIEITRRHERLEDFAGRGRVRLGEDGLSFGAGCAGCCP